MRFFKKFFHPSIDPSIHPSIHQSIHQSIHPSIHPSIHASIHSLTIHRFIHPSVASSVESSHGFIHPSTPGCPSVCSLIRLSSIHPSIHLVLSITCSLLLQLCCDVCDVSLRHVFVCSYLFLSLSLSLSSRPTPSHPCHGKVILHFEVQSFPVLRVGTHV